MKPNSQWLLAGLLAAVLMAPPASAQTLKLGSVHLVRSDIVGPWVTYRVRTRSGRTAVREFKQRIAIVGKEKYAGQDAYWVELKTSDRTNIRYERGLFAPGKSEEDDFELGELDDDGRGGVKITGDPKPVSPSAGPLRLVRYQVLTGGKLFEYPVSSAYSPRAGGGVSTYELFEFDPSVKPEHHSLGPDTLRLGSRVVPAMLEWTSRAGNDDWPVFEDSTSRYRMVLTQMTWKNPAVPVTGFARSLFRVTAKRVPVVADSMRLVLMPPDTSLTFSAADTTIVPTTMKPSDGALLSWTEVVLESLGADAVAEVTQKPEPAPEGDTGGIIR
jgi:hypothetical protein